MYTEIEIFYIYIYRFNPLGEVGFRYRFFTNGKCILTHEVWTKQASTIDSMIHLARMPNDPNPDALQMSIQFDAYVPPSFLAS